MAFPSARLADSPCWKSRKRFTAATTSCYSASAKATMRTTCPRPTPRGIGATLAMQRALTAARLLPADIDYINLHGTATRVGDAAEDLAVSALFDNRPPCSSTKGQTGHTLGAAGIVEAIVSVLAICHGLLPGSAHTETVDPSFRSRYQLVSEPARIDTVLSNSFGFGGGNCSLIFGRTR